MMRTVDAFLLPAYQRVMSTHRVNLDQARDQLSGLITVTSEGGDRDYRAERQAIGSLGSGRRLKRLQNVSADGS